MSEIRLADFVESLREELMLAMAKGEGEPLRFDLQEVEIEAQVTASHVEGGKAGIKFAVIEAGVDSHRTRTDVHTVKLKLKPERADPPALEESDTGQKKKVLLGRRE